MSTRSRISTTGGNASRLGDTRSRSFQERKLWPPSAPSRRGDNSRRVPVPTTGLGGAGDLGRRSASTAPPPPNVPAHTAAQMLPVDRTAVCGVHPDINSSTKYMTQGGASGTRWSRPGLAFLTARTGHRRGGGAGGRLAVVLIVYVAFTCASSADGGQTMDRDQIETVGLRGRDAW